MNKTWRIFYILPIVFMGLILTTSSEVKHIPVRSTDTYESLSVNVLDFGAKGDGVANDTEAIRSAVKATFERRRIPQHPQYGYFVSFAEVYFPCGYYIINDTIDINAVKIRGENYAAIEQKDPEKDIFFTADAWRQLIEGMTFLGGKVQLNLGNNNVDTGHVTVRDCQFKNSSGPAVQMRKGSNSTFFKVENCVFINCEQAVINNCDMSVIRDCWISSSRQMKNKAVMENYGVMHVENLLGVPRVRRGDEGFTEQWVDPNGRTRTASNQRWIDNYGVVNIRNSRFGGEGGGFTAVYNFARYQYKYPVTPNSVTIESSYLYNAQTTAIVLKEIPNVITVTNNHGLIDCWMVRLDPGLDLDTYFDMDGHPHNISINISNNYGGGYFGTGLPEQLWPYQLNEIVGEAPPKKGNWTRGQFIRNPNVEKHYEQEKGWVWVKTPAIEEPQGWLCTESGKPGKWKDIYFSESPLKTQ